MHALKITNIKHCSRRKWYYAIVPCYAIHIIKNEHNQNNFEHNANKCDHNGVFWGNLESNNAAKN